MGGFPLVHAGIVAAFVDHTGTVAQQHVLVLYTHMFQQFDAGDTRRTRAVRDDFQVGQFTTGDVGGIDDAGGGDDGGAVLVVVEDGNVAQFFEPLLDDKAIRRLDVFQIDAAEGRS